MFYSAGTLFPLTFYFYIDTYRTQHFFNLTEAEMKQKPTVQIQYKLDKDLIKRVRGLCDARGTKPEDAINQAMQDWIDKELGTKRDEEM